MDSVSVGAASSASKTLDATSAEAAKVANNLLTRLLGPSADLVGAQWAEALRQKNLERLLRKTEKRAGATNNPGIANPRLASQVFEAAQFADDEVVAEYLSGVLASSRDTEGRNDSGVGWSALVNRMSSDQLKLHYLVYASTRSSLIDFGPENANALNEEELLLDLNAILANMRIETSDGINRFADALDGLMREGLIDDTYAYGPIDSITESRGKHGKYLHTPIKFGLHVGATIHGIRLFLWGMGLGRGSVDQYLDGAVVMEPAEVEGSLKLVEAGAYRKLWNNEDPNASAP